MLRVENNGTAYFSEILLHLEIEISYSSCIAFRSVGCTVVEMLTTKPPLFFEYLSVMQLMYRIMNHMIEPPTDCTSLAFGFLKRCLW